MSRSDGGAGFFPEVRKPPVKRAHGGRRMPAAKGETSVEGLENVNESVPGNPPMMVRRQGLAKRPLGLNVPGRRIFRRAPGRPKVLCETA